VIVVVGTVAFLRLAVPFTLHLIGARPVEEDELPRLQNLVDGLCPTFGVRPPRLMAVDDPLPNACSVATRPNHGTLVVTTGLETALDLIEMEGVLSHELAHLKRSDAVVSAVAVAVLAPITWITGRDTLLHRLVGRGRELRADLVAVRAVRYPPGLRDALVRFSSQPVPQPGSLFSGRRFAMSRWLWVDQSVGDRHTRQPGDLDVTAVRIDALAEL
jgi:Zn-dependent protease with chaperone function